jgi:hypothetical protein
MKLSLIFTQFLEDKERKIRGAYHETMEEDDDDDDDDDEDEDGEEDEKVCVVFRFY